MHVLIFLIMSVMTDYPTKTNPQKVLFYIIDQLAWPCSLWFKQQEAAATNILNSKSCGLFWQWHP